MTDYYCTNCGEAMIATSDGVECKRCSISWHGDPVTFGLNTSPPPPGYLEAREAEAIGEFDARNGGKVLYADPNLIVKRTDEPDNPGPIHAEYMVVSPSTDSIVFLSYEEWRTLVLWIDQGASIPI